MDEARRVIERLERIEELRGARAPAADLLGEVRHLLREGEAWLAAERVGERRGAVDAGTDEASAALERCRQKLGGDGEVMPERPRSAAL